MHYKWLQSGWRYVEILHLKSFLNLPMLDLDITNS
jgi:hypothetical protein